MTGLPLSPQDHEWVTAKWALIRKSQQTADKANNDWTRINAEINDYLDRDGTHDIVQRAQVKSQSLALADAYDVGKWHAGNAQRHIDDVMLFLRLKELGVL